MYDSLIVNPCMLLEMETPQSCFKPLICRHYHRFTDDWLDLYFPFRYEDLDD